MHTTPRIRTLRCSECREPATWVRETQFSGVHLFCDHHARKEGDFGKSNSYFFWTPFQVWHKRMRERAEKKGK